MNYLLYQPATSCMKCLALCVCIYLILLQYNVADRWTGIWRIAEREGFQSQFGQIVSWIHEIEKEPAVNITDNIPQLSSEIHQKRRFSWLRTRFATTHTTAMATT